MPSDSPDVSNNVLPETTTDMALQPVHLDGEFTDDDLENEVFEDEESEQQDPNQRLVGDLAIWFVIMIELLTFGLFFLTYAFKRAHQVELFNRMQLTLDLHAGVINTVLLITSSWCVANSVHAVRNDNSKIGARWLAVSMLCGGGFLWMKIHEFNAKFAAGIDMSTNDFYMFYFMLAGFHMLHVVVGMVILAVLWVGTWRGRYGAQNAHPLETGAAFWHMVDLLWIILFPLVYVMR